MSRITSIERLDQERYNKQGEVLATYCVFEKEGVKLFQINTYGSENREYIGQPSQIIQFDKKFVKEFISILIDEFW